jgi:drug/metabolite transporter (DMT)-like permease
MHRVTGRWRLGLSLALVTAFCWGVLPVALKIALQDMDAYTITWYRFTVSTVVLGAILALRGRLPAVTGPGRKTWGLLTVALVGLAGNYVLYAVALNYTTPAINQVVSQASPLFLLLGGLVVFKETFSRYQWLGFATLVGGLLLFFNRRLPELLQVNTGLGLGVMLLLFSSLIWTAYALAQKMLLKRLSPAHVLLFIYVGSTLLLLPFARPGSVRGLDAMHVGALAFCCANTLVAYGAFTEALEHWEVSRVSAVIALGPLFTLGAMRVAVHVFPGLLEAEQITALGIAGALMVVAGSALCAFGQTRGS